MLEHTSLAADQSTAYCAGWHAHLDVLTGCAEGFAVAPFEVAYAAVR